MLDGKKEYRSTCIDRNMDAATVGHFGAAVRACGILLELRVRLPFAQRKSLDVRGGILTLAMAEEFEDEFRSAATLVTDALQTIESRPVIPREIEDILSISTAERRRWLQDGRLPSAGTRTVKLRGRAKRITFHLFDPALVEDLLDRGIVDEWREDDAAAQLENRRRAAYQAILTRSLKKAVKTRSETETRAQSVTSDLTGWEEFSRRHDCTRPAKLNHHPRSHCQAAAIQT